MSKSYSRFARARRRVPGEMNGLESAYAERLKVLCMTGEIREWKFEAVTLVVARPPQAKPSRYTPDFFVVNKDGEIEFHETKGFMQEDARVKLKCAAEQYPFKFVVVRKQAKRDGGGFVFEEF
jgi:hypothetical protein